MKNIKKRIKQIDSQIDDLTKERELLQTSFKHQKYRLGTFSWRVGNTEIMRICNICNKVLTNPTQEEYNQFINENNQGQGHKEYDNEKNNN